MFFNETGYRRTNPWSINLPPSLYDIDLRLSQEIRLSSSMRNCRLVRSIIEGDSAEVINTLISYGYDVNSRHHDDLTPLHYAVVNRNCNYDIVLTLLRAGADIHARSRYEGATPIHFAVQNPCMKPEIVRALLTWQGADVNVLSGSSYKFTPLHYALGKECKEEIVRVLLDFRADVTKVGRGLLPIHVALMNSKCSMEVIELLIRKGSNVSTPCCVGSPLFILLCRTDCDGEIFRLMLRNGANPNFDVRINFNYQLEGSLRVLNCDNSVYNLIENFNPHALPTHGYYRHARPLLAALMQPNISTDDLKYLLRRSDCDPNYILLDTRSVLAIVVESAKIDLPKLRILLKYGAKFNENAEFSDTHSLFSLLYRKEELALSLRVLKVFIDCYDDFKKITSETGCDLLHYCIEHNISPSHIRLLLKHCMVPDHVHLCGFSALHHAALSEIPLDVIEELLQQSECVNVRDEDHNTPLHLAGRLPEVVKLLLRYGADATLVNKQKKNPFHVYFDFNLWDPNSEVLLLLLKAMVLNEYLKSGFFDCNFFISDLVEKLDSEVRNQVKEVFKPLVQDCQSELGYACSYDPAVFYMLVSRFSMKLQLRKGFIKSKIQSSEEKLLIKEKMLQTLHDGKLLVMLKSKQYPLYGDFSLLLLNKLELSVLASELKIPLKTKDLLDIKYATPVSILLLAEYLTSSELTNLILAFI